MMCPLRDKGRLVLEIGLNNRVRQMNAEHPIQLADPTDYFIWRSPCLMAYPRSLEPVLETPRTDARVIAGGEALIVTGLPSLTSILQPERYLQN
jgi:hypothetical protein